MAHPARFNVFLGCLFRIGLTEQIDFIFNKYRRGIPIVYPWVIHTEHNGETQYWTGGYKHLHRTIGDHALWAYFECGGV